MLPPNAVPDAWAVFGYLVDHTADLLPWPVCHASLAHATDDGDRFTIGMTA